MPSLPKSLTDERGGTLLEMAVVLPTFFLLLFGIFNFVIVLFGYSNATYAARAASRYASIHSTTSLVPCNIACISTYATQFLYAAPSGGVTITTTYGSANTVGSTVKVFVRIAYTVVIPFSSVRNISVGSTAQRTIVQ